MKWPAAGALLVLAGLTGCGSQYRPVINPINQTGPAPQPTAYVAVFSQPGLTPPATLPTNGPPCPTSSSGVVTAYPSPGVVTVLDATGDSVSALATLGNGPLTFALDSTGAFAFSQNCDGTLSSMVISATLQTKNVTTSTLLPGAAPINALALSSSSQYVVEQGRNAIAALGGSGSAPTLKVEITDIAPSVINMTGAAKSTRVYAISQGNSGASGSLAWGACANPSAVTVNGEADGIEVASNSVSSRIPVGVCPVYGLTSADGQRAFILNRGSGTITVINAQANQLDTVNASPYLNGTATINLCNGATPCNAGPVYGDFYTPGNLLVVANYDNNTVSVIDTSLDVYGNDSATFGKVLATIPVGANPAGVSVLQDGSRAYVANEGIPCNGTNSVTCTSNGTVTVVSLTSFTTLKTIQLGSSVPNPRSIASNYNYPAGNVFVAGQNSPYVAVIRTDTDEISAQTLVQGDVVDLRTTNQYASQTTANNSIIQSRSVGSGAP